MSSIISFASRGPYGDARYPGNASGYATEYVMRPHRRRYFGEKQSEPGIFSDICEGSKTSAHLAAALIKRGWNLEYHGFDLREGYDMTQDSLIERLPRPASFLNIHPPYWAIKRYSGFVWGDRPLPNDLSHAPTYKDFLELLKLSVDNGFEALLPGGRYALLIADLRKEGKYISVQSDILQFCPGQLDGIIIKEQLNCSSDSRTYANEDELIRITHEYYLVLKKEEKVLCWLGEAMEKSSRLKMLADVTWSTVVDKALRSLGGRARLPEIYAFISENATEKLKNNTNWEARVRGTLRQVAVAEERGVWAHPSVARCRAA